MQKAKSESLVADWRTKQNK